MLEKIDSALIRAWIRWNVCKERLLYEEKGASDIVAILVAIVIVIAVAAIFKTQLTTLVTKTFEKATKWVTEN